MPVPPSLGAGAGMEATCGGVYRQRAAWVQRRGRKLRAASVTMALEANVPVGLSLGKIQGHSTEVGSCLLEKMMMSQSHDER
jgi:hypothetical protein